MKRRPVPIEQPDAGNVTHPHSASAILRKRIMSAGALVLLALMSTGYFYHRSAYLRNNGDWRLFWIGEVFIAGWLIFGVVHVLKKGP